MTVLIVEKYVVNPGKEADFNRFWQRILRYRKEKPEMLKEIKSMKLYTQMFGGISGAKIELVEFDNLAGYENLMARVMKDEEMMKMHVEFMALVDPTTYSTEVLNANE